MSWSLDIEPAAAPLRGAIKPPGDKSISHRALIFGGLAHGTTKIEGLLRSDDTEATRCAMEQLGARFETEGDTLLVTGIGSEGLSKPDQVLDMGNSGTAMRLLAGVLAGQPFRSELVGDASLNGRPMGRIIKPLKLMGARIDAQEGGTAPLVIHGNADLSAIAYDSPVASAQVKSCVLLAGLFAKGHTSVTEPRLSRDHTERMLPQFGVRMGAGISLQGGQKLKATTVRVPSDPSSAAFLAAAAILVPDSDITIQEVGLNDTRDGFFVTLIDMGAELSIENERVRGGERVADIHVQYSPDLEGVEVPADRIPSMIDEVPVLLALAARANGTTRIRDAAELRVKESDRLAVMAQGLAAMGTRLQEVPDGIDVWGGETSRASLESHHDHRCAMSFALLGLVSEGGVQVHNAEYIDTSYPEFVDQMSQLGASMRRQAT